MKAVRLAGSLKGVSPSRDNCKVVRVKPRSVGTSLDRVEINPCLTHVTSPVLEELP